MPQPIRFIFGLHLHQPVGNFGSVFSQHLDEVTALLQKVDEREFFPLVLHISGPLLEWLESNGKGYLDMVGRLVDAGRLELLCAGMYEPVLASLPAGPDRADRLDAGEAQETVRDRCGSLLTERVWEPELAADLATPGYSMPWWMTVISGDRLRAKPAARTVDDRERRPANRPLPD
jgi:hypothetical protein